MTPACCSVHTHSVLCDGKSTAEEIVRAAIDMGLDSVGFSGHSWFPPDDSWIMKPEDIPVYTAPLDALTRLTGFHLTRGILCAMRRPPLPTAEAVCANARRIAVLENVMNPTNLGAIFRCAAGLGIDAVLLTAAGSDPLYRRASRVSMGNVFLIPWAYLPEGDWPALLRGWGFTTAAMALRQDSLRLDDPLLAGAEKLAVVLGTEGDGLAPDTIAHCDHTVMIPMTNGVDSLNVAAAAAVAFYQLGKK